MTLVYQIAVIFLLLNIGAGLIRILRGPTPADRLLAVQLFGTTGTAILILLSMEADNDAYKNVALAFALLSGILGVAFARYGQAPRPTSTPAKEG
ncbi:monovalent cation/H+ antiporter complex subunit F [Aggregatilineales bacterium SYSU G02658]